MFFAVDSVSRPRQALPQRIRRARFGAKQLLKRSLQRLGLHYYWGGELRCRSVVLDFLADPARTDGALLAVRKAARLQQVELRVNGTAVTAPRVAQLGRQALFRVPVEALEPWENVLALPIGPRWTATALLPAWETRERVGGALRAGLRLAEPRAGSLKAGPVEVPLAQEAHAGAIPSEPLELAAHHIRRAVNFASPRFGGTVAGCYEADHRSYCLGSWIWTNGVVVRSLLEPGPGGEPLDHALAVSIGERLLDFQVREGRHAGAFPVRWDTTSASRDGYTAWYAPNDCAFIGSYAFCSLYDATGDPRYLRAAVDAGEWILREGLEPDGRLRIGFRLDTATWVRDWIYADSGFTSCLFRDLHRITGEDRWADAARRFSTWYVSRLFDTRDNYFYASVIRDCSEGVRRQFARGQAWAMDGLLATWEATGDPFFVETSLRAAHNVARHQLPNGAWSYLLDRPGSGVCNKGTAVLGWHLHRLARITGDDALRAAALRAYDWARSAQVRASDDPALVGGFPGLNEEGSISRLLVTTAFPYAAAFFVLLDAEVGERAGAIRLLAPAGATPRPSQPREGVHR